MTIDGIDKGLKSLQQDERLRKRAQRIAKPMHDEDQNTKKEWLTFELQNEIYALEARFLVAVNARSNFTPLVLHDGLISGLVNWQGNILGILNLQQWLKNIHYSASTNSPSSSTLIIGKQRAEWGIAVAKILDLVNISVKEAQNCVLKNNNSSEDGVVLGKFQSEIWLLDGEVVLSRMNKLLER